MYRYRFKYFITRVLCAHRYATTICIHIPTYTYACSSRRTRFGATLSISAPRNLRQQNLPAAVGRNTQVDVVRPAWATPPPLLPLLPLPGPSGAGIDYEIAPDKANERPPRRAWPMWFSRVPLYARQCWLLFRLYRPDVLYPSRAHARTKPPPLATRFTKVHLARSPPCPTVCSTSRPVFFPPAETQKLTLPPFCRYTSL